MKQTHFQWPGEKIDHVPLSLYIVQSPYPLYSKLFGDMAGFLLLLYLTRGLEAYIIPKNYSMLLTSVIHMLARLKGAKGFSSV